MGGRGNGQGKADPGFALYWNFLQGLAGLRSSRKDLEKCPKCPLELLEPEKEEERVRKSPGA